MNIPLPAMWETIVILTVSSILFICVYRLYTQYGKPQTHFRLTTLLIGATLLVFLGIIGLIVSRYAPLFIRILLTTSLVYGVLSSYYYLVFLLSDTHQFKSGDRIFPVVSMVLVFILFLDYLRGNYVGSFVISDPFTPNVTNILYYVCLFLLLPCMKICTIVFLLGNLKQYTGDATLTFRRVIWIIGFTIATVADLSVVIKLIAYILLGNAYQQGFSVFFFVATTIVTSLFLIAMLPQNIFAVVAAPFERFTNQRRQQEDASIADLHSLLIQIVTVIRLPDGYISPGRMLVEIGHARRIIGTTMQRTGPISLGDEARYIAQVVQAGEPLTEGAYPPFPKPQNARKHYIALVHQLAALGLAVSTHTSPGVYVYQDTNKSS